jgi:hypothetical protein
VISCPEGFVIENHQVTGKYSGFQWCNISTAKRRLARFQRPATRSLPRKRKLFLYELRQLLAVFANRE